MAPSPDIALFEVPPDGGRITARLFEPSFGTRLRAQTA
jgi:hypothetical protein